MDFALEPQNLMEQFPLRLAIELMRQGAFSKRYGWRRVTTDVNNDPSAPVYKGIPYAAPTVGDLRWRAPQQVKA
jgi:hypothetical protein